MRNVTKLSVTVVVCVLAGAANLLFAQAATGPAVKPAVVAKKAGSAAPATAKPTKTAGGTKTTISTANHATDDDSF